MCITTQPVRNGVETLHVTARFSSAKAYPPTFHDVAQMWIGCLVILPSLHWLWLSPSMCGLWGRHKRFWSWQTGRETNVAWATNGTNPTCSFALLRTTQSACRCRSEGETFKFETWGLCCFIVGERLFLETRFGDWALGLTWALRTQGCGILFVSAPVLKVRLWSAPRIWTRRRPPRAPQEQLPTFMAPSGMPGTAGCHIHRILCQVFINAIVHNTASVINPTYNRCRTTLHPSIHLDHRRVPGKGPHGHLAL